MEYVSGGILLQYRFPANVEDPTELVILSDDVKVISEKVFDYDGRIGSDVIKNIIIPEIVTEIEDRAFYYLKKLQCIMIPKSVEKIGERAFGYYDDDSRTEDFRIYGYTGTEAQRYADENGISFISVDDTEMWFDEFTLGYYKTKEVNYELYELIGHFFQTEVPDDDEEAKCLLDEALAVYKKDFERAKECLSDACCGYLERQGYDFEAYTLRAYTAEEKAFFREYSKIYHNIYSAHGAVAGLNGDWQTAHDCFVKAYDYLHCYLKRGDEGYSVTINALLCKAIGITSLLLGDPVEAFRRYREEQDHLYHSLCCLNGDRRLSACSKRMAEAMVMSGNIELAEKYCLDAVEWRKSAVNTARKENIGPDEYTDWYDMEQWAYDQYRLGYITKEYDCFEEVIGWLKKYNYGFPYITRAQRATIEANIERIEKAGRENNL